MLARNNPSATRRSSMAVALLLSVSALGVSAPTLADHRHGRHSHVGVGIHAGYGGPRVSVHFSSPPYRPWYHAPRAYYAPPPVYYAPRVVVPAPLVWVPPLVHAPRVYVPPTVYVERGDLDSAPPAPAPAPAVPVPQASGHWFFCVDSNTYYPYVTHCASPWQPVVPTPPGALR